MVNVDYALFSIAMFKQINACSDNPSTIYVFNRLYFPLENSWKVDNPSIFLWKIVARHVLLFWGIVCFEINKELFFIQT